MPQSKIKKLIKEIETLRNSRIITYVTSNRENIESDIESSDIINFRKHLDDICRECNTLDLFLFSYGGEIEAAWEIVNLMREYNFDFSVIVPYHARSAATMIALGAKEIVMGKMGALGPIDPTIRIKGGELGGMELSASDIDSFEDFLREEYQVKKPEDKMRAFKILGENISPLLIGKAYRNYIETKKDAEKLLRRHIKDPKKVKKIVQCFIKDIRTHNHSISRQEARKAGLNIGYASNKLEKPMWELYQAYAEAMEMETPYIDEPPKNKTTSKVIFTYIESTNLISKKVGLINFKKLNFPKGSYLVANEEIGQAIHTPKDEVIPLIPKGQLIAANDYIYDKTEMVRWE
jgi:ATP-dependent protease ClpP protease subunit